MYFLGIDAGGSKCSARLCDGAGNILGQGLAGPANMNLGVGTVFARIMEATAQAIADANRGAQAVSQIKAGIGVAGISRAGALSALQAQDFPFARTKINNDGFIANLGAHAGQDGGVVIIGTGSIAIGRVGGKDIRIGGYGFPVSDEGSGAYIGLEALRLVLRANDGRVEHSKLTQDLLAQYHGEAHEIVGWMDKATATDYASLSPQVMQAAEAGDMHGCAVIKHAAAHVELMVESLYKHGVTRCAIFGGVAPHIKPWLSPDIQARLVEPSGDALDGALWLARQV